MPEREEPPYPSGYRRVPDDDWREQTTPGLTPVPGPGSTALYGTSGYGSSRVDPPGHQPPPYDEPRYDQTRYDQRGYGQGAVDEHGYGWPRHGRSGYDEPVYDRPGAPPATAPDYSNRPVAARRPDALAALALLVAGIAAAVSLLLTWLAHSEETGWTLLREAIGNLGGLLRTGMWQPLAIILGGGLLFLLGLLMLIPARAHRALGLLALLVTGAVGAGVLVPLADARWHLGVFDTGFFCGMAVAALGLLGSLKALLTGPRLSNRTPPTY